VACDTNGTKMTGGVTRAQYAASRGVPTTFTCLPQYRENISNHQNNIGNPSYSPPGSMTAAEIIYKVSADHGVSSKALIVLLQKEQALVTDEWPVPRQYQIATGYGCPDTAPCDQQYYGFVNQVTKAASQFKKYVNNPSGYRYRAGKVNSIYWSPTTSCGASDVFIENGATAALYNYTPYRPNQAALNNLYGTGDGCSAYGNRNFWRYFRDWFGSTVSNLPVPYGACPSGLSPIYRSYNDTQKRHHFTGSYNELSFIYTHWGDSWRYEGAAFCSRYPNVGETFNRPVYRLYSDYLGQYIFTSDENEKNVLSGNGYWRYEGVAWYAPSNTSITGGISVKPVYRLYSDYLQRFIFTKDENEKNVLSGNGYWRYEGVAWYAN
jgi:hypothetical protein